MEQTGQQISLDDFFAVLNKESEFVDQLKCLNRSWQKHFLNLYLQDRVPQWRDGKGIHLVFNAIQRKYNLELGFCRYYETDLKEEFKQAQTVEGYDSTEGFCWRYLKSNVKCGGLTCHSNDQSIIILIE